MIRTRLLGRYKVAIWSYYMLLEFKKVRRLCFRSLRLDPFQMKLYLYLLATFFPIEQEISDIWSIGIYKLALLNGNLKLSIDRSVKNPILSAKNLKKEGIDYAADPFLVSTDACKYLFFEAFKGAKGEIGLAVSKDYKEWEYKSIVLSEPFHLSYPMIFKWGQQYYMLPETHETSSVRLYQATHFPYKWRFIKTLFEGKAFVDPTLLRYKDHFWIFVSDISDANLYLYYADTLQGPWKSHPKSPIIINNKSIARPGGNIIQIQDKLIRIAQDDFNSYGHALRAFEITLLSTEEYEEKELPTSPLLKASTKGWNKDGMHHLSVCQVGEKEWVAAVDGKISIKNYKLRRKDKRKVWADLREKV